MMQKGLPMSHSDIVNLTPNRSRAATAEPSSSSSGKGVTTEQGETHRTTGKGSQRDVHGFTVGNLTWAQRMREWRKSAFKKKDDVTWEYKYRWTNWPICERFKAEPGYARSCSKRSRQYFDCDFTWEMAIEADRLAFRQEQSERKGKGSGKPGQQTFDV